jgi:hypothetical protein
MTTEIFDPLAALVERSNTLSSRQRNDIGVHLRTISVEIQTLAAQNPQAARSIGNFLTCALFESTRDERTDVLATAARKGMLLSFRPYETTHPVLVEQGYGLANILSALGV